MATPGSNGYSIERKIDPKRIALGILCLAAMLVSLAFLLFAPREFIYGGYNITYPDGCVEGYIAGKLVTPECVVGRGMIKRDENLVWTVLHDRLCNSSNGTATLCAV